MNPLPTPVKARKLATDTKPPAPLSESLLPEATARLQLMADETKAFTAKWHTWFAGRELAGKYNCPEHKDQVLTVNVEESILKSWVSRPRNQIAFSMCPYCVLAIRNAKENCVLEQRGVPKDMLHCAFETFKPRTPDDANALQYAREYSEGMQGAALLLGKDYGVGKTHLAVATMRVAYRRFGWKIKFTTHAAFIKALRDGYSDPKARDIIEDSINTPFLVIDDIGVTSGGRDEVPAIHTVLDERKSGNKPFVLTSNVPSLAALEPLLGGRMMDRLFEFTVATVILSGKSMRKPRF